MQKKVIALAVAGLVSGAAFAQSNVTIYGVVDAYYANAKSKNAAGDLKMSGLQNGGLSGNRIGFKGEEALGNGLKALFLWELGSMTVDGGAGVQNAGTNGIGNTRQSYIGLASASVGTFTAGRLYSAGHTFGTKFDAEGSSVFSPVGRMSNGVGLQVDGVGGNNARWNSALGWASPNWNGFTVKANYGFGEQEAATTGTNDTQAYALGLDYDHGPLSVGFVYSAMNHNGTTGQVTGAADRDLDEWALGASYDFKVVKLVGSYQDFKQKGATSIGGAATAGATNKGDIWNVGVVVPVMSAGSVRVSYASLDRKSSTAGVTTDADASAWGLSYQHALSKRTTAYAGYSKVSNKTGSALNTGFGAGAPSADLNSSGIAIGMRHVF